MLASASNFQPSGSTSTPPLLTTHTMSTSAAAEKNESTIVRVAHIPNDIPAFVEGVKERAKKLRGGYVKLHQEDFDQLCQLVLTLAPQPVPDNSPRKPGQKAKHRSKACLHCGKKIGNASRRCKCCHVFDPFKKGIVDNVETKNP